MQFECAELYLMCNHHSLITRDSFVSFCCTRTRSVTKGPKDWTERKRVSPAILSRAVCVFTQLRSTRQRNWNAWFTPAGDTTNQALYSRSVLPRMFFILLRLRLLFAQSTKRKRYIPLPINTKRTNVMLSVLSADWFAEYAIQPPPQLNASATLWGVLMHVFLFICTLYRHMNNILSAKMHFKLNIQGYYYLSAFWIPHIWTLKIMKLLCGLSERTAFCLIWFDVSSPLTSIKMKWHSIYVYVCILKFST